MNYGDHMTHWKGRSLRTMTQAELIELCQTLNALYHTSRGELERLRTKAGLSVYN